LAAGPFLRQYLEGLGLAAGPALEPVFELVARVQNARQRRAWATRSSLLYALARLHPEIRAAVFVPPEAWQVFVSEMGLERLDSLIERDAENSSGGDATAPA
jgi:hypothetical protein